MVSYHSFRIATLFKSTRAGGGGGEENIRLWAAISRIARSHRMWQFN